jgi:hypothetical protein
LRSQQRDRIANIDPELLREVAAEQNARRLAFRLRRQRGDTPLLHRLPDIGDASLERRVHAFQADERLGAVRDDQRFSENGRPGPDDALDFLKLLDLGLVVLDSTRLPYVDVGHRPEDAVAQLALQSGHQRERDHERHDAHGHAQRRDERNEGDERLLPARKQVPKRDEELESHVCRRTFRPAFISVS